MAISLVGPRRHESQPDEVQFMVRDGDGERRIRLKATDNRALYNFLVERLGPEPESGGDG
ncbi:MAG: hypothetical protein QOE45_1407 [Frankiaceae bacterium]|jgi:hypothetical protein|nr:hypothetical protein [Frankiaceae bacterium]